MDSFRLSLDERHVYPPREDTELLLSALTDADGLAGRRALEMGPGTGLVSLTLAARGAMVTAIDLNPHACRLTRQNAEQNGLLPRVAVVRGDLWGPLKPGARFDLVAFNPPYLPAEPEDRVEGWMEHALSGGETGLEVTQRFLQGLPAHLAPGGTAYLLLSSLAPIETLPDEAARLGLTWRAVAAEKHFFERLSVVALTAQTSSEKPL